MEFFAVVLGILICLITVLTFVGILRLIADKEQKLLQKYGYGEEE
jgi:hypothetical protein